MTQHDYSGLPPGKPPTLRELGAISLKAKLAHERRELRERRELAAASFALGALLGAGLVAAAVQLFDGQWWLLALVPVVVLARVVNARVPR